MINTNIHNTKGRCTYNQNIPTANISLPPLDHIPELLCVLSNFYRTVPQICPLNDNKLLLQTSVFSLRELQEVIFSKVIITNIFDRLTCSDRKLSAIIQGPVFLLTIIVVKIEVKKYNKMLN